LDNPKLAYVGFMYVAPPTPNYLMRHQPMWLCRLQHWPQ